MVDRIANVRGVAIADEDERPGSNRRQPLGCRRIGGPPQANQREIGSKDVRVIHVHRPDTSSHIVASRGEHGVVVHDRVDDRRKAFLPRGLCGGERRLNVRVLVAAETRRGEDERLNHLWIIEREVDGHSGAEGEADQRRAPDADRLQQRVEIVAVRERIVRGRRAADAAHVIAEHRLARCERRDLRVPHAPVEYGASADQHDRRSAARDVVGERRSIHRRGSHALTVA